MNKTEQQLDHVVELLERLMHMSQPAQSSPIRLAERPSQVTGETYRGFVTAPSVVTDDAQVSATVTVVPDCTSNLINVAIVRNAGLIAMVKETKAEDDRHYVRGEAYYSSKWVKISWLVPDYMKHREDIFYVIADCPFDMVVPNLQQSDADRRLLDATRPDDDEIEALPVFGPHRSRSEFISPVR